MSSASTCSACHSESCRCSPPSTSQRSWRAEVRGDGRGDGVPVLEAYDEHDAVHPVDVEDGAHRAGQDRHPVEGQQHLVGPGADPGARSSRQEDRCRAGGAHLAAREARTIRMRTPETSRSRSSGSMWPASGTTVSTAPSTCVRDPPGVRRRGQDVAGADEHVRRDAVEHLQRVGALVGHAVLVEPDHRVARRADQSFDRQCGVRETQRPAEDEPAHHQPLHDRCAATGPAGQGAGAQRQHPRDLGAHQLPRLGKAERDRVERAGGGGHEGHPGRRARRSRAVPRRAPSGSSRRSSGRRARAVRWGRGSRSGPPMSRASRSMVVCERGTGVDSPCPRWSHVTMRMPWPNSRCRSRTW